MASSSTHQSLSPSYRSLLTFAASNEDRPGPRCGHSLTLVRSRQLVLFGGCASSVSTDAFSSTGIRFHGVTNLLHFYDVVTNKWTRMNLPGVPPSPRAGHAAAAIGSVLVIHGGISPFGLVSEDVYMLDMTTNDFNWQILKIDGVGPCPRYGHVMVYVDNRWLVMFGGTSGVESGDVLADTWILDTYRNLAWKRVNPRTRGFPPPCGRMYATACVRQDGLVLICGGRDHLGMPLSDAYALKMNTEEVWHWYRVPGVSPSPLYQHTAVFQGARMHVMGGLANNSLLIDGDVVTSVIDSEHGLWYQRIPEFSVNFIFRQNQNQLMRRCRHAAASVGNRIFVFGGLREDTLLDDLVVADTSLASMASSSGPTRVTNIQSLMRRSSSESSLERLREDPRLPTIESAFYGKFEEDGPLQQEFTQRLVDKIISALLLPRDWTPPVNRQFFLTYFEFDYLCHVMERIFKKEETVLKLNVPIKIFGDIHGQFADLMSLFREYGSPSTESDITHTDYLFLGDYVDRGRHSLETIVLLFALKIQYPKNFHMIRGNHEAILINTVYGFYGECKERFGEEQGHKAWSMINTVFDLLPLAAVVANRALCVHGGIGRTQVIRDIERVERPANPETGCDVLKDTLWSDPSDSKSITNSGRGGRVVSFGADVVKQFVKRNNLDMVIRAHECVMDGYERFADGKLITVFSATNYCGHSNNAGAILVIGRDLVVYPKVIHPPPPPVLALEEEDPDVIEGIEELNIN